MVKVRFFSLSASTGFKVRLRVSILLFGSSHLACRCWCFSSARLRILDGNATHQTFPAEVRRLALHPIYPSFLPTRVYIARLEGEYAATARARRARYIWASSFWDEDKTKKTLSRSHWTISRNLFLMDMMLATFLTSVVVFVRRFGPDLVEWPLTLGVFALEYYLRCLFHLFVQVQWFSSTLEMHDQRTWKLLSSLMSVHFFRVGSVIICLMFALGIAGATVGAFFMLRVLFPGQNSGETSWVNYLLGVLGLMSFPAGVGGTCFFLFMAGWQILNIARDTIWRVKRTYSRDDWARRHTPTTTPDREIQLV